MLRAEQCFSTQEVADLLHTTREKVGWYRVYGLLPGTKTGRGYTFTAGNINKFLTLTEGADISNRQKILLFAQKKGLAQGRHQSRKESERNAHQ